jgi:lysozyme
MKILKLSPTGVELIKSFEGFSAKPYRCPAGVPTIGYGATYYTKIKKVTMADAAITKGEATVLLTNMLGAYERAVDSYCIDTITQNQFDALVSFAYNLGTGALKSSTLLKKVNADPNDPDIRKEFMKWVNAGGVTLAGLVRRRHDEADLYFKKD